MQPSKDGYVELNGVRTWYAEYGDASACPLVLLHPGGGGIDARALILALAPSRPASGCTPRSGAPTAAPRIRPGRSATT